MSRRIARVRRVLQSGIHYRGFPEELAHLGPHQPMPAAAWVVTQPSTTHGGFALVRFAEDGVFAGDTWSETEREALRVASLEFDLGRWIDVPDGEVDPIAYAKRTTDGGA